MVALNSVLTIQSFEVIENSWNVAFDQQGSVFPTNTFGLFSLFKPQTDKEENIYLLIFFEYFDRVLCFDF